MNKNKQKLNGVGEQASHGRHWDRGGYWNPENQNGARFGDGRGGGRDGNNGRGVGGRGGNGSNTNPPHQNGQKLGAADRTGAKEVGWCRRNDDLMGMGKPPWGQPSAPTGEGGASHSAPTEEGETSVEPAIGANRRRWGQPFGAHRRRGNLRGASHSAPTGEVGPAIGAHRTLVRPAIVALTVRSAIGAQIILVRHAMRRSQ